MRKQLVSGSIRYCPCNLLMNVAVAERSGNCTHLNWTAPSLGTPGTSGINTTPSFLQQMNVAFHKHVIINFFLIILCHYTLFTNSNSLRTTSHCGDDTARYWRLEAVGLPSPASFVNFVLYYPFVSLCSFCFPNKLQHWGSRINVNISGRISNN